VKVGSLPKPQTPDYNWKILFADVDPEGIDKGRETVSFQNVSGTALTLANWLLRTPTRNILLDDSHPTKPGDQLTITLSEESLPNKGGFIELFDPNGKLVDRVKYSKSGKKYDFVHL